MLLLAEARGWEEYKPRIWNMKIILYNYKQKKFHDSRCTYVDIMYEIAYKQIFLIMSKYLCFKTEKDSKCSPTFVHYCKILFSTHFLSQSWFNPPLKAPCLRFLFMYKQRMCQIDKSHFVLPTNLCNSPLLRLFNWILSLGLYWF